MGIFSWLSYLLSSFKHMYDVMCSLLFKMMLEVGYGEGQGRGIILSSSQVYLGEMRKHTQYRQYISRNSLDIVVAKLGLTPSVYLQC